MNRLPVTKGWIVLAVGVALAFFLPTAAAGSKAAQWLVKQEIAEGCGEGAKGRFAPGAVIERDLTGDGKKDLIISHEGLQCVSDGRSGYCGMRTCLVLLYVREGDLLAKKDEILSIGVSVGVGNPPVINFVSDKGEKYPVRWNGLAFE